MAKALFQKKPLLSQMVVQLIEQKGTDMSGNSGDITIRVAMGAEKSYPFDPASLRKVLKGTGFSRTQMDRETAANPQLNSDKYAGSYIRLMKAVLEALKMTDPAVDPVREQ
jgi:hypothetical protein